MHACCNPLLLHGVAALLERLEVVLEDGDEGVDAAVADVGRHEEQHPLRGEVGRHEVGRAPRPEVQLVERERQPAVHLHVRAQHVLAHGARRQAFPLDGAGAREVDERPEVGAVHAGHLVVDHLRRVLQRPAQEVRHRRRRERPQDQVAEVLGGEAQPVAPIHGQPDLRGLVGVQAAGARHGAPQVGEDGLEPAERAAAALRRPAPERRDEVLGEVRLVDDDVLGALAVAVVRLAAGGAVLPAAVVVLDARRGAGLEEPRLVEVAGGVAVGGDVVGGEADGEGAAAEPGELEEHHLLELLALQVRVQAQELRGGLGGRHVHEVGVHGRLHEARAAVVEEHRGGAVGGRAQLPREGAVLGQHRGEALLDRRRRRCRRREGVDDGHLHLVRHPVEDGQWDVLAPRRRGRAGIVGGPHELGAQHLHLHCCRRSSCLPASSG
uniref:Uncharacterized protein n=1 Tax=Setaria italica TaxID=4555 RepID=K3ZTE9_SETIT